ncbi:MAG: DUF2971 domain-containing protein [Verrucomicrobiales bacterium]|nr:DUF2971 domain-containing protein [Verrucomicrobiales bacterium]
MKNPQILYRFIPWESALKTFDSENLKLGRIDSLNDPFELLPAFPESSSNLLAWHAQHDIMRSVFQEHYGLLCFAEKELIFQPEMWSRYADHHRGVALGFEIVEEEKNDKKNCYLNHAENFRESLPPVHLVRCPKENERIEIPEIEELVNSPTDSHGELIQRFLKKGRNGGVEDLLTRKGYGWRHEKEWRCVCQLDCDSFIYRNGSYFFSLNNLRISELVLGWKNTSDRTEIEKINHKWGAVVKKMKPTAKRYKLEVDHQF